MSRTVVDAQTGEVITDLQALADADQALHYVEGELKDARNEVARLRAHLASMVTIFHEEVSAGDGVRDDHVERYQAARAALDAKDVEP